MGIWGSHSWIFPYGNFGVWQLVFAQIRSLQSDNAAFFKGGFWDPKPCFAPTVTLGTSQHGTPLLNFRILMGKRCFPAVWLNPFTTDTGSESLITLEQPQPFFWRWFGLTDILNLSEALRGSLIPRKATFSLCANPSQPQTP